MSLLHFLGPDGVEVPVSASSPLPTSGSGGGMSPEDITAQAPATWDPETATIGVSVGTSSGTVAAGDHSHTPASIGAATAAQGELAETAVQPSDLSPVATSGSYMDLQDRPSLPSPAEYVDPSSETFAEDLVAALIAAGLMNPAP